MKNLALLLLVALVACQTAPEHQWYRGNLHTHTLWSDGDDFPESVLDWYQEAGYDFVAISDHNTLSHGERWVVVDSVRRTAIARLPEGTIQTRTSGDTLFARLSTFNEYSDRQLLVIQSQEITDGFDGRPLHLNAANIQEEIEPRGGQSVTDVLQRNIDAVREQEAALGVPMLPHVNHPNFGWAVAPDDLVPLVGERFFEVYNGHPAVHNYGEDGRPGMEAMWDYVNSRRLQRGLPILLGLAVDDAHHYQEYRVGRANPGRGWVMVRAASRTVESLIEALRVGDFYGSSGVLLEGLDSGPESITLTIAAQEGVTYETAFVGADLDGNPAVFSRVTGREASYTFNGEEMFVRATVTSSRLMPNPHVEGEVEKAWTQPVVTN